MLIKGQWQSDPDFATNEKGEFVRKGSQFRKFIQADQSTEFPARANRYHLYISYACPWACRALIVRKLKRLENVISLSVVDAFMGKNGWTFGQESKATHDPLYQCKYLYEIYVKAQADYTGKVTVPVLWDKETETIVNNESAEIIRMLNSEFNQFTDATLDLYPETLRKDIDAINDFVYDNINNGVYRCGFAKSQEAYDAAFDQLFATLDELEKRLEQQTYLVGDTITEADWRLFTTLIRFDAVYVAHFKCNLRRIADYPNLSRYLIQLYHLPGIKETIHMDHIKQHYFQSHIKINPTGIVPKGPELDFL